MRAPHLNRKLVLEEAQRVADGAGGFALTWVAMGALWAAVDAGTGRERAGEFATLSQVTYRITVRAAPQVPAHHLLRIVARARLDKAAQQIDLRILADVRGCGQCTAV